MKGHADLIGEAGLRFFGRMSASISHEMKNALAIIRENSGLLNDYTEMIDKGISIEPERFKKVATRIAAQTQRVDTIIKNLNQFAHTVDNACKSVDLNQMLVLLVALSHRPAAMQQVTLVPRPSDSPVLITTAPFTLLNTLGLCLTFALQAVPPGEAMTLGVMKSAFGACISFGQLTNSADLPLDGFPAEYEKALLDALGAQWRFETGADQLVIDLPKE
jgi:C4-dicarboxylate-specific signal transduction histidine kinase